MFSVLWWNIYLASFVANLSCGYSMSKITSVLSRLSDSRLTLRWINDTKGSRTVCGGDYIVRNIKQYLLKFSSLIYSYMNLEKKTRIHIHLESVWITVSYNINYCIRLIIWFNCSILNLRFALAWNFKL